MEEIKGAFDIVKKDISYLFEEISSIKQDFLDLQRSVLELGKITKEYFEKERSSHNQLINSQTDRQTEKFELDTNLEENKTDNTLFRPLNANNLGISIGNQGVQTDRQTHQQTDRQLGNTLNEASEALNSLEFAKAELTKKIKKLTEKEMLVFLTIYQLEDQGKKVNYKILSTKLNLTESSIRDYIRRLIFKGIPLDKIKENNKEIFLSITQNLRKLANLTTLIQLRETN